MLLPASLNPLAPAAADSFDFRLIASVPYPAYRRVVCGDADHDGRQELLAQSQGAERTLSILEFGPGMEYEVTPLAVHRATAWFMSDLDRDGRTDLGLGFGTTNDTVYIYESQDSASLPLRPVSQVSAPANTGGAIVTDVDSDSAREVCLKSFTLGGLCIFECEGDNRYVFKTVTRDTGIHGGTYGFGCTQDVDRDGLPELWWVDGDPYVGIYEAVADDSLILKRTFRLPLNSTWDGAVCGAPDIDRNGRTEAIVLAVDPDNGSLLAIFESPADDSFEIVWSTWLPRATNWPTVGVGDVTGDGTPEIAVAMNYITLFRCTGPHQYEQFWEQRTGGAAVGLYDLNNDGRAEVICSTNRDSTDIYEYLPVGVEERARAALERVTVSPSVARRSEVVRVAGLPASAECEVVDASGRIVASLVSGIWRPASCVAGAYFVRIRVGGQAVVRKVLVVE